MNARTCIITLGIAATAIALLLAGPSRAAAAADEKIFSGPQPGEKITAFKVIDAGGTTAGREHEVPEAPAAGAAAPKATMLVFVHGIERSIVPLVTVIDDYAQQRRESLATTFVFLTADRVASEKRVPLVGQSLRLRSPLTISIDGAEGPGNYGLSKECLLTIVLAKEGKATANFALVQPGFADAPAVIKAMAEATGDANPPTADALREKRMAEGAADGARRGAGRDGPMTRPATRPAGARAGATTRPAN